MTRHLREGLAALLLLAPVATPGFAETLTVTREGGAEIVRLDVPDGEGWCILWHHSVKGFEVSDCYENRGGEMVLTWSHLPDFAAGLDHIPGRGRQVTDGAGGYFILDIDEPVPGAVYVLRPGAGSVDHRIKMGDRVISLSAVAPRERVRIALTGDDDR